MAGALKLARRGLGRVEPNPAVGAVLVRNDKIIGRGYHRFFGAPHAEVTALRDAKAKGHSAKGATLYVTLEPCCHWGKTPPCTDTVIAAGIKKVIAATLDPSKKVAGKGVDALKKAGIEVQVGILADEAKKLNKWFFKFHQKHHPWIICKWAQTLDGKLAARSGHSKWISSDSSRREAHKIRHSCQAIIVGVETVLADDPQLTARLKNVSQLPAGPPNRVVLDTKLRTPVSSQLVQTANKIPTWIFTSCLAGKARTEVFKNKGVKIIILPIGKNGLIDIKSFLKFAARQGWARIMVEGGAKLLSSFILSKLADELVLFQSSALALDDQAVQFRGQTTFQVNNFLKRYKFHSVSKAGGDLILRLLVT